MLSFRRFPTNRNARCERWQRVRGTGGRRLLRCAKLKVPRRPLPWGFQRGRTPFNKGAVCIRRKRFYSPYYDERVLRCVKYDRSAKKRRRRPARVAPVPAPRKVQPKKRAVTQVKKTAPKRQPKKTTPQRQRAFIPYSLLPIEKLTVGRTPAMKKKKRRR